MKFSGINATVKAMTDSKVERARVMDSLGLDRQEEAPWATDAMDVESTPVEDNCHVD
jgi:adenylosuccinate lyase